MSVSVYKENGAEEQKQPDRMSKNKIEAARFSTTTIEERTASSLSMSDDDVFYSTPNAGDSEVVCQGHHRHNSDISDHALTHTLGAYQHSSSTGAIDRLVNPIHSTHVSYDPYATYSRRHNNNELIYRQNISVRYLQPPTPPQPGPIIIREIRAPPPREEPPLVIRQHPPIPRTPPPIIIRERPPLPPPVEPPCVVNRYLAAPPPPPRKIIIQRQAPLPRKPQPIIIEKWLPYKPPPKRRVVIERAPPPIRRPTQVHTVVTHNSPRVNIVQHIQHLGTVRVDPHMYSTQYASQLSSSEYVRNMMTRFGLGSNYSQMIHMQTAPCSSARHQNRFQTIDNYPSKHRAMNDDEQVASRPDQSPSEDQAVFIEEPISPYEPEELDQPAMVQED